jgi:hypothetical protein
MCASQNEHMPPRISTHKLLLILLGSALLLGTLATIFGTRGKEREEPTVPSPLPTTATTSPNPSAYYYHRPSYFEFIIAKNWDSVPLAELKLPEDLRAAQFAFQKSGTGCIMVYGEAPNDFLKNYRQTSFADRINIQDGQFAPSWYLHKKYPPDNLEFQWEGKQPFRNEVLMGQFGIFTSRDRDMSYEFILYDTNGDVVDDTCTNDVLDMVRTLRKRIETVKLDGNSRGVVFFSGYNDEKRLFLLADGDPIVHRTTVPVPSFRMTPLVRDNGLYYLRNDDKLYFGDIFSGTERVALGAGDADPDTVINEFYFHGNSIFYLYGPWCQEYLARCNLSLFEYNQKNGTHTLLASPVTSRRIAGYNSTLNTLDMYWSEGDGGCFWATTERFEFMTLTLRKGPDYSGCDEEFTSTNTAFEKSLREFNEYRGVSSLYSTTTTSIRIEVQLPGPREELRFELSQ